MLQARIRFAHSDAVRARLRDKLELDLIPLVDWVATLVGSSEPVDVDRIEECRRRLVEGSACISPAYVLMVLKNIVRAAYKQQPLIASLEPNRAVVQEAQHVPEGNGYVIRCPDSVGKRLKSIFEQELTTPKAMEVRRKQLIVLLHTPFLFKAGSNPKKAKIRGMGISNGALAKLLGLEQKQQPTINVAKKKLLVMLEPRKAEDHPLVWQGATCIISRLVLKQIAARKLLYPARFNREHGWAIETLWWLLELIQWEGRERCEMLHAVQDGAPFIYARINHDFARISVDRVLPVMAQLTSDPEYAWRVTVYDFIPPVKRVASTQTIRKRAVVKITQRAKLPKRRVK